MLHIAICEDERLYSDRMTQLVMNFFETENEPVEITAYTDGLPLLESITEGKEFQLILLDLQLENSDGMEIAANIRRQDCRVPLVFVTGMENRAIEGYAVEALDYVVKSQLDARLKVALQRFMKNYRENALILDTSDGGRMILPYKDILWVESENRGVRVVTEGNIYSSSQSISKITDLLPVKDFIEVHKSVFVRIDGIKRIGSNQIIMKNDQQLPLSRRKRKEVMKSVLDAVKGRM